MAPNRSRSLSRASSNLPDISAGNDSSYPPAEKKQSTRRPNRYAVESGAARRPIPIPPGVFLARSHERNNRYIGLEAVKREEARKVAVRRNEKSKKNKPPHGEPALRPAGQTSVPGGDDDTDDDFAYQERHKRARLESISPSRPGTVPQHAKGQDKETMAVGEEK